MKDRASQWRKGVLMEQATASDPNAESAATTSIWMKTEMPSQAVLTENRDADVCVVGAGIAGMTTAYLLTQEGKSVIVLDDGCIGGGETARTTAHLSNALDDRYTEIEQLFGRQGARLAAESHTTAIDCIESIVRTENIACDFERLDGYLFVPPDESTGVLQRELLATHGAGLTEVEWIERAPLDCFDTGPCLRFPRQAQFHPLKYLAGLSGAIKRDGGMIFIGTHVDEIDGGRPARVTTETGSTVTADAVVVATNSPINDLLVTHLKQTSYRTYVIAARIPKGAVTKALYWDTADPYHYVRLSEENHYDTLIVGGEDHRTGEENDGDERFACLEEWSRERFPMIQKIDYRWSGQIVEPIDSMGFIGQIPLDSPNMYLVTGDSGNGMTHGTIAGMLLTDLILCRKNRWTKFYDPSRFTCNSFSDFAQENFIVLAHYADWFGDADVSSRDEIQPGEGALIRCGPLKIAAYRDERGLLHERLAVCQHLGCIVAWNSSEKSWDCPCHGARYDRYGHVINGPSSHNLISTHLGSEH